MTKMLAAALAGLAASGFAANAQAATPNACFWARDITNWKNVGDQVVNIEVNHRDVYRLDLAIPCTQLAFAHESLVLDARGNFGPVCENSLADVVVPHQGGLHCPVKTITKLSKEEAKALPNKERP